MNNVMREIRISLPSIVEQRRIAEVLNGIDITIRKTEQLIQKMKQMQQGLLHDLLTRGIDENGEIRDPERKPEQFEKSSLGLIPKKWKVSALDAHAMRITDGSHQSVQRENGALSHIPFLFVSCVRDGVIHWDGAAWISRRTYGRVSRGREPHQGMVLYTVVGSLGHAAVLRDGAAVAFERNIACISVATSLLPDFLADWLNSASARLTAERLAVGNAQKLITLSTLKQLSMPLPALVEQQHIIDAIASHRARLTEESAYCNKLRRLKAGLMEDLLTGRVRTTNLAVVVL